MTVWMPENQQYSEKGGGEFISALYNLIHGFISSDESMTDIQ